MNTKLLCENPRWDSGTHDACEHMGFKICTKYNEKIIEDADGWRNCCVSCLIPYYKVLIIKPKE